MENNCKIVIFSCSYVRYEKYSKIESETITKKQKKTKLQNYTIIAS